MFKFGDTLVNLLQDREATELMTGACRVNARPDPRGQFTLAVDDVDAMCAELTRRGVELLNCPMDRPWASGRRASRVRAATSGRSRSRIGKCPQEPT